MKKYVKVVALGLVGLFFGSVLLQFGYNMLFVKAFAAETTKAATEGSPRCSINPNFWRTPILRMRS